jgi:hypothetical protein
MQVILGSKNRLNKFELFEALESPEIEKMVQIYFEAVKISHRDVIHELRKKKKEALLQGDGDGKKDQEAPDSKILSISSIQQVYIDDPRLFRFLDILMTNPEYKEDVLKEHLAVHGDVYKCDNENT